MLRKKNWYLYPIIAVVILLSIASFTAFYYNAKEYLRSICNAELADYATHNAYSTKCELEKAISLTQSASESFTSVHDFSTEDVFRKLKIINHDTPFELMTVCSTDGTGFDSNGSTADYTAFPFFIRTSMGESNVATWDIDGDNQLEIVASAPIITEGKVTGTIHGTYQSFDLSKIINVDSFNGEGYAALVQSNGDIIVPANSTDRLNADNTNYWTFFRHVSLENGNTVDTMLNDIHAGKSGIALYSIGDRHRELYYTPVGINDWYLLQMVTTDVVTNYTAPMTRMVMLLIAALAVLVLIIGLSIHKRMEQGRKEKAAETERFRTLASNIPGGVAEILVGNDFLLQYANDGFFQIMGYSRKAFMAEPVSGHCMRIVSAETTSAITDEILKQIDQSDHVLLDYPIQCADGSLRWINMSGNIMHNESNKVLLQALVTDITLQKARTAEITENAKLDKMTQLYDKVSVTDLVGEELLHTQTGIVHALLIIDIDNFKSVNDTYGHQLGDTAIIQIAQTICHSFHETDIKGRVGGDEFLVLVRNVGTLGNASRMAHIFQQNIRNLEFVGRQGVLSCSVGGVLFPLDQACTFERIFREADTNLYAIKKGEKGTSKITSIMGKGELA